MNKYKTNITEVAFTQADQTKRQSWQRPTPKHLRLSLDTTFTPGSGADSIGRAELN